MLKKFNHIWADLPKLKQINSNEGRRYAVNEETKYPSITTVLSKTKDLTALKAWRKRVGEEMANKITTAATTRGTSMHKLCEDYLLNQTLDDLGSTSGELLFRGIRPYLDRIDNVQALESGLFSHKLHVAGTVDCVADYDGELTIIDFKTSKSVKRESYIHDYYIQGAFYFTSFYELTGQLPKQILVLISVQDGSVQEFFIRGKDIIHWTEQLRERIKQYESSQAK
jgi:ATP-dependent exoDNAse (exonuclease V) beta subunit